MTLEELTKAISDKAAMAPPLKATIKFDLGETGVITLDSTSMPAKVSNDDVEVNSTLAISAENLARMINGQLDPTMAYMTGKVKVKGDMGPVMKLSSLLDD